MVALLVFSVALTRILTTATILLFCLVLKASIEYEYYRVSISSWKRWLTIIAAISGIPLLVTSQIQVVPFAPEDFRLLSSHNFMVASYMVRYYHLVAKGALFGSSIFLWTRTDCKKVYDYTSCLCSLHLLTWIIAIYMANNRHRSSAAAGDLSSAILFGAARSESVTPLRNKNRTIRQYDSFRYHSVLSDQGRISSNGTVP